MNCGFGGTDRYRVNADEYIRIPVDNEILAEKLQTEIFPNLSLHVACELNSASMSIGLNRLGRVEPVYGFSAWPLICKATKLEGWVDSPVSKKVFDVDVTGKSPAVSFFLE